jgi:putative ABC transport system permease protein
MNFYLSALLLGLGYSALAMGIFLSMRIFNIPDITTDGSFTLGGAVTATLLTSGFSPLSSLPLVFIAGATAGACTGLIHTRLKVNALLSGILVMTALYSFNLAVMGRSNIPLTGVKTLFSEWENSTLSQGIILTAFTLITFIFLAWLLKTDFGLAMRATGNNDSMMRSLGMNTDKMKIAGLALANGLTALSGFLICQVQGFADIGMGIGIVVLGLGSVMIGEIFINLFSRNNITFHLLGVILGAVLFRILLAFALSLGFDALYLKLIVALFVLLTVSIPQLSKRDPGNG